MGRLIDTDHLFFSSQLCDRVAEKITQKYIRFRYDG